MKTIEVRCAHCGSPVVKYLKEYTRQAALGRNFYCDSACSAKSKVGSGLHPNRIIPCERCDISFLSLRMHGKYTTYCSRSCASLATVTDARREAAREAGRKNRGNLISVESTLKKREAWRYVALEGELRGIPHEFELGFGGYVYDLFLPSYGTLVEFDDPYHSSTSQKASDHIKDLVGKLFGYEVIRVQTQSNEVIPISALASIEYARQQLLAA